MTGPSWLIDSKRIATKIKYASESVDPSRIRWISNPTKACPNCNYLIDNSDVVQEWPGLPQGVKFDPSDQELLGHLLAKVGKYNVRPHPLINEFIPTVDEDDGICYTHPQKLPGVKLDGSASHFFHRTFKAYNTGTRKRRKIQQNGDDVRWHKTGKTKPVIIDGVHVGCKKIMVLYSSLKKGEKSEKTNWVMHQYHLGTSEDENDGEFVVSKVFYQQQQLLKPFDNNKREVEDLPTMMVQTFEVEAFVAATSEAELAFAVDNGPASGSAISAELCIQDAHHLGQVSSHDVVMEKSIAINECEGAPNPEPGKIVNQDNDNQLNVGDDSKWWEGESQFLLDSQQLAEGIALCDEFLQSQSSCGGEVEEAKRIKPFLLSEYAHKGGVDDFKKDLEECQTLSTSHFLLVDRQQHTTGFELFDTPPDMRLSQLEFGSQDTFLA